MGHLCRGGGGGGGRGGGDGHADELRQIKRDRKITWCGSSHSHTISTRSDISANLFTVTRCIGVLYLFV